MGGIDLRFIGIDLAWKCGPDPRTSTAICECDQYGQLSHPFMVGTDEEILEHIPGPDRCWLAIDAPLNVPNRFGSREVEKEVARSGVRILPSNRDFLNRKCGGVRGEQLALELERRGFLHLSTEVVDPGIMVEVYPFGVLYGITRGKPPRYKHGGIEQRREGCLSVLDAMGRWELSLKGLEWMEGQIERADSRRMKNMGDMVDSMLCAMCLYAHWLYRGHRTRLYGDGSDGCILIV